MVNLFRKVTNQNNERQEQTRFENKESRVTKPQVIPSTATQSILGFHPYGGEAKNDHSPDGYMHMRDTTEQQL